MKSIQEVNLNDLFCRIRLLVLTPLCSMLFKFFTVVRTHGTKKVNDGQFSGKD